MRSSILLFLPIASVSASRLALETVPVYALPREDQNPHPLLDSPRHPGILRLRGNLADRDVHPYWIKAAHWAEFLVGLAASGSLVGFGTYKAITAYGNGQQSGDSSRQHRRTFRDIELVYVPSQAPLAIAGGPLPRRISSAALSKRTVGQVRLQSRGWQRVLLGIGGGFPIGVAAGAIAGFVEKHRADEAAKNNEA
ncbi:hypothetical protein CF326_g3678 [Tilletia indica]|nr:hypothetical protein CF326_g3678 [Tilletia indica]